MSKTQGLVSKIIPFSVVDGPGNRLVVFLQGCNFNCINCHNPHTIGLCDACGICVDECPAKALRIEEALSGEEIRLPSNHAADGTTKAEEGSPNHTDTGSPAVRKKDSPPPTRRIIYDEALCIHCDRCIAVCPSNSNPRVRWMTVEEVLAEVRKVLPFISGITVSGGEATRQAEFVRELFTAVKSDPQLQHLTALIDSNGSASLAAWEQLLPVTDGAMIDLKALNPEVHRQLTSVTNEAVLATIEELYKRGKLTEVRLLLIPGYNMDLEQLRRTAAYLATVSPGVRLRLIPFRKHGIRKIAEGLQEPQREQMEEARGIFQGAGFDEIVVT